MSATPPVWKTRPFLIGAGVAAANIAVTWGLHLSALASFERFAAGIEATGLRRGDPGYVEAVMQGYDRPFSLSLLSWPIPSAAIAESGGAASFWSFLVQGLWLGAIVGTGLSAKLQTRAVYAALVAFPVIVLFAISGSFAAALFAGGVTGFLLVGTIWYGIFKLGRRTRGS